MNSRLLPLAILAAATFLPQATSLAWDYEGHRIVNELALASLPTNFPSFVLTPEARERIAFLAGEPDRWRNTSDLTLKHYNGPDHYLDMEELDPLGMDVRHLTPFRHEFTARLGIYRAKAAEKLPPIDPAKNADHTRELAGFLPWAIAEHYAKLKSAFSYLKALEDAGTPDEVANGRQNILYIMGVMGHYVGDGAQPLHTTIHHNGWVGENPNHYPTNKTIHLWIDGGYINYAEITTARLLNKVQPATSLLAKEARGNQTNVFPLVLDYLLDQHKLVEPLYKLEREGMLSSRKPVMEEGYNFISGQLLKGGQMLGSFWLTAWQNAPVDTYLRTQLTKRRLAKEKSKASQRKTDEN